VRRAIQREKSHFVRGTRLALLLGERTPKVGGAFVKRG
jgi:hypothetical protein